MKTDAEFLDLLDSLRGCDSHFADGVPMRARATLTADHLRKVMTFVQSTDAIELLRESRVYIVHGTAMREFVGLPDDGLLAKVDEAIAAHDKSVEAELALERR